MNPSHSHSFVLVIAAFFVMSFCFMIPCQGENGIPDYKNANLPVEKRVEDLLKRMTLEEKLAQIQYLEETIQGNLTTVAGLIRKDGLGAAGKSAENMNAMQKFIIENTRLGIPVLLHGEAENGPRHKAKVIARFFHQ